jgi:hypothetical protein
MKTAAMALRVEPDKEFMSLAPYRRGALSARGNRPRRNRLLRTLIPANGKAAFLLYNRGEMPVHFNFNAGRASF